MGLLSPSMKTELKKANPSVYVVVEVDLPTGTVFWSKVGVGSPGYAQYTSKVLKFGTVSRKTAPRANTIATFGCMITINDVDFSFLNVLGQGYQLENSAVRIWLASLNVNRPTSVSDTTGWYLIFGGYLSAWKQTPGKPLQWDLDFTTDAARLGRKFPNYELSKFDFINIDKGALGTHQKDKNVVLNDTLSNYSPIAYGKQDDFGDQNAGAIPCLAVDPITNFWYLVSLGWVNVLRVYNNGAIQLKSTYSILHKIINGRFYTIIQFTGSQSTATITADVEGYETVGDGTGTMICDPVGVLQHLVTNWCLNDYANGKWRATDFTFFDQTSWALLQTQLSRRANGCGYACARYVSNQTTLKSTLDDWAESFSIMLYWTNRGTLGAKLDLPNLQYPNTTFDDPWLKFEECTAVTFAYDGQEQVNRIVATFQNMAAGGSGSSSSQTIPKEYYQIEIIDPRSKFFSDEQISLNWGPSTFP